MKAIEEAFKELRQAISAVDLIILFFNAIFFFLFSVLLLLLLKLYWGYAFIPTLSYLLYFGHKKATSNKFLRTEQTTPQLKEKLRTAADNLDKENEIVSLLHQEVIKDMKNIETTTFLDFRDLSIKATLILGLSFLIVFVAYLNVGLDFPEFSKKIQEPIATLKERVAGQDVPNVNRHVPEGNLSLVLGNKSLALLGKKELIIKLNPLASEINLDEVKDAEKKTSTLQHTQKKYILATI